MNNTRTVDVPPETESTEWLLRLQAWAHGGDALLLEAADELSKLRKDAERYRWLREREVEIRRYATVGQRASERLDDQIDAAIEEARAVGAA